MIKSELIQIIASKNPHLSHRDIEKIVNTILKEISKALAEGNRVELRGFGTFIVKCRQPRIARNPKTGEKVEVGKKYIPYFKSGKAMKIRLNDGKLLNSD